MAEVLERPSPLFEAENGFEDETLEFLAVPVLERIGTVVAAFLNGKGGRLIVGVQDRPDPEQGRRILGIDDSDAVQLRVRDYLARTISPSASVSVAVEQISGRPCLVVDVPHGQAAPYVYQDRIFVRAGGQARAASPAELSALVTQRYQEPMRWERLPALGVTLADLEEGEIARTAHDAQKGRLLFPYSPAAEGEALPVLERLSLCQDGQLLNSALVLFGRAPARHFPQLRLRVVRFASEDRALMLDSRVFEGHAFALLQEAEDFLHRALPVVSRLPKRGLGREDRAAYPWAAVREALVNAVVHRDYAAYDGGLSLSVYPDRLEFWNAGTLPPGWTVRDLTAGHISRPHNPDIAHVFFLRGLMERIGTGVARIVEACAAAGLPAPEWSLGGGGVLLTLRQAAPAAKEPGGSETLPSRIQLFLRDTSPGTTFRRRDYAQRVPALSERTVRNDLARVVALGYAAAVGAGPQSAYRRTEKLFSDPAQQV